MAVTATRRTSPDQQAAAFEPKPELDPRDLMAQAAIDPRCDAAFDARLRDFCRELYLNPSLTTTTSILAHEYRRLFRADRVWVFLPRGRAFHVQAVSGIPGFQRRAEVVRRLEELIGRACQTRQPFAWTAGQPSSLAPRVLKSLDRYLDESHVAQLRVEPILETEQHDDQSATGHRSKVSAVIVVEWFQPAKDLCRESHWVAARQLTSRAIEVAADWSRAPLALSLRGWRRRRNVRSLTGWMLASLIGCIAVGVLACIPIDDTIEAIGDLQPVHQRHVFATSTGVVKELGVTTGDDVAQGTPLMVLEDSELEQEFRRVEGDLQTTERRVSSIEASRLDHGSATSETVSQMNTLAGDLSEQLQRRENLRRELELLSFRRKQLEVASPIAGQVVTWDLERLLTRRPVSRGQRLLTVADTHGPWQVELRIADADFHDLSEVLRSHEAAVVDFIVVTMPEIKRSTRVRAVSETVEIRSPGEGPTVLCLADVPEDVTSFAAAGLGVRGRIHCGRKAAAVVGFRKLWRFVQEHVLFPWGL